MATRSDIIVELPDSRYKRVYAHWDGYLKGNGKTLIQHYNSAERARELVEPGDISSLEERCDKPAGHTFDKAVAGCTTYYGRDRGETGCEGTIYNSLAEAMTEASPEEYRYVWTRGSWWVVGHRESGDMSDVSDLERLETVLIRGKILDADGVERF